MREFGEVTDSPSPVMTFQAAGTWLAVPVEQMDRIAVAEHLWPVPMAWRSHAGLMDDDGELLPVLRLGESKSGDEQLVAILHVRGEAVGMAVEAAGRVYDSYRTMDDGSQAPAAIAAAAPKRAQSTDAEFWLIDPDRLWTSPREAHPPTV